MTKEDTKTKYFIVGVYFLFTLYTKTLFVLCRFTQFSSKLHVSDSRALSENKRTKRVTVKLTTARQNTETKLCSDM